MDTEQNNKVRFLLTLLQLGRDNFYHRDSIVWQSLVGIGLNSKSTLSILDRVWMDEICKDVHVNWVQMKKLSYTVAHLEIANCLLNLGPMNANYAYFLTLLVSCEQLESSSFKHD